MILETDENQMTISPCGLCCFGIFEQTQPWHKKQVGCKFDRVNKFKDRGTFVEWVEGDAVSANKIHVFCNNFRDSTMIGKQTIEEFAIKVRTDNTIKWTAIIHSSESEVIKSIKRTILSLTKQTLKPSKIVVSLDNPDIDFVELVSSIRTLHTSIPVFFNKVLETKYDRYLIDNAMSKVDTTYYVAILAGTEIETNTIKNIDCMINDDCKMVSIGLNQDNSVMFVHKLIHESLGGNLECVFGEEEVKFSLLEEKLEAINSEYSETIICL